MANPEHLAILKQGVEQWNKWRERHLEVGPDLSAADLSKANLIGAKLNGATLRDADFTGAQAHYTIFADVDVSAAKGLETVEHDGPSTVGIDTIYKSHGKIPEVFLRGCGVPDNFIEYMHSLAGAAFEYYSCFISYSHQDKLFARRLHDALQRHGVRAGWTRSRFCPPTTSTNRLTVAFGCGTRWCSAAPSSRSRVGGWTMKLIAPSKRNAS